MERNVTRTFDNGSYSVALTATGDTDNFAQHADDIVSDVTATLDDDVLPAVAHAVASQASQPAADSTVTYRDVVDDTVETAPAPVRSVNPVAETVQVNLHGVNVTLIVAVELKADFTTDVLDLQKIVRETVTGPTSIQINAAIVGACVLGVAVHVPTGLGGLFGSDLSGLLGSHGHHHADGVTRPGSDPLSSGLLNAFRDAASSAGRHPLDDDVFDFGPTGPWNPRTTTTTPPRKTTTIPRGW